MVFFHRWRWSQHNIMLLLHHRYPNASQKMELNRWGDEEVVWGLVLRDWNGVTKLVEEAGDKLGLVSKCPLWCHVSNTLVRWVQHSWQPKGSLKFTTKRSSLLKRKTLYYNRNTKITKNSLKEKRKKNAMSRRQEEKYGMQAARTQSCAQAANSSKKSRAKKAMKCNTPLSKGTFLSGKFQLGTKWFKSNNPSI